MYVRRQDNAHDVDDPASSRCRRILLLYRRRTNRPLSDAADDQRSRTSPAVGVQRLAVLVGDSITVSVHRRSDRHPTSAKSDSLDQRCSGLDQRTRATAHKERILITGRRSLVSSRLGREGSNLGRRTVYAGWMG